MSEDRAPGSDNGWRDELHNLSATVTRIEANQKSFEGRTSDDIQVLGASVEQILQRIERNERHAVREAREERAANEARFERLQETLRENSRGIYAQLERDRKTPWAPVAVGVTLILAVCSFFGAVAQREITRNETSLVQEREERKREVEALTSEFRRLFEGLDDEVTERVKEGQYRRGLDDAQWKMQMAQNERDAKWIRRIEDEFTFFKDATSRNRFTDADGAALRELLEGRIRDLRDDFEGHRSKGEHTGAAERLRALERAAWEGD